MDFQFAPWERLTSEVNDGEADAELDVDGEIWLLRRCGELHFARALDQSWNYLLRPVVSAISSRGAREWQEPEASQLPMLLRQKQSRAQMLGRLWQLKSNAVATWSALEGWRLRKKISEFLLQEDSVPFRFSPAGSLPSSAVFAALQSTWNNPDSDLIYSARFSQLNELERALLGVQTQIGTPHEWAAIVIATARVCGSRWPAEIEATELRFRADGAQLRFTCAINPIFGVRERAVLGHLMRACQPQQLPDDTAFPMALRTRTSGNWSRSFSMEIARPSCHEQLEAALELRAWLQVHWPDGVKQLDKIV